MEILNSLIYDFFGQVEEIGTQEYFWELYPKETKEFLEALLEQITMYETKMNRIDTTYSFMVDILNEFFEQLQTRKIKINPTEHCPTITDCETLSGDFDKSVVRRLQIVKHYLEILINLWKHVKFIIILKVKR